MMLELEINNGEILVYGHRGAGFLAPENTMASFQIAYEIGVDAIELDVHQTSDGALVVMHDSDVSRTTDGMGLLEEMTLAEVQALDAGIRFNEAYAGEGIPRFEVVLDWAKDRIPLLVEIKGYPHPPESIEKSIVSAIRDAGMTDQVLVKSFFHQSIRNLDDLAPEIPTGILLASAPLDPVRMAQEAGADSIRNFYAYWTESALALAREAGMHTSAWGVNDRLALNRVTALGLDSFGTDRPRWTLSKLMEMGCR